MLRQIAKERVEHTEADHRIDQLLQRVEFRLRLFLCAPDIERDARHDRQIGRLAPESRDAFVNGGAKTSHGAA